MNKTRRAVLTDIQRQLEASKNRLEIVMNQEQESFDNLTEGLQATMRGSAMEEAIDNISLAIDSIDEAIAYIDEATI